MVGVSDYQFNNRGVPAPYNTHRDAQQFAEKLRTAACGSFPENNVKLLTNAQATLSEVQKALRSFLAKPG